ncbi:MAG: carbonic anhydrase [Patescibacteria group bacterium]
MAHNCSSLVLHCMDFRLQPAIRRWLEQQNLLGDCDVVSVAGACKDLDEGVGDFIWKQIDISYRLHNMRQIILMNHTDCGAYGGRMPDDENKHQEIMARTEKLIASKYPDIKVKKVLVTVGEQGEIEWQE